MDYTKESNKEYNNYLKDWWEIAEIKFEGDIEYAYVINRYTGEVKKNKIDEREKVT
jgi:hypothetical protein